MDQTGDTLNPKRQQRPKTIILKTSNNGTVLRPNTRHLSGHGSNFSRVKSKTQTLVSPGANQNQNLILDFHERVSKTPQKTFGGMNSTRSKEGQKIKFPEMFDFKKEENPDSLGNEWQLMGGERLKTEDFGYLDNFQGVAFSQNDKNYTLTNEDDGEEYSIHDEQDYVVPYEELNHFFLEREAGRIIFKEVIKCKSHYPSEVDDTNSEGVFPFNRILFMSKNNGLTSEFMKPFTPRRKIATNKSKLNKQNKIVSNYPGQPFTGTEVFKSRIFSVNNFLTKTGTMAKKIVLQNIQDYPDGDELEVRPGTAVKATAADHPKLVASVVRNVGTYEIDNPHDNKTTGFATEVSRKVKPQGKRALVAQNLRPRQIESPQTLEKPSLDEPRGSFQPENVLNRYVKSTRNVISEVDNSKDEEDFDIDGNKKKKLIKEMEGLSKIEAQNMLYDNFSKDVNQENLLSLRKRYGMNQSLFRFQDTKPKTLDEKKSHLLASISSLLITQINKSI